VVCEVLHVHGGKADVVEDRPEDFAAAFGGVVDAAALALGTRWNDKRGSIFKISGSSTIYVGSVSAGIFGRNF
jgi:hypothetical protein